jgi:hypothetical protein
MNRQNRALAFVIFFSVAALGVLLWTTGVLRAPEAVENKRVSQEAPTGPGPESMGDPVPSDSPASAAKIEAQKSFAQILMDLGDCFGLKTPQSSDEAPVSVETLLLHLQSELGPPSRQIDRWMSWHFHNREGRERRLRLEITETDTGTMKRELHLFAVDRDGQPVPLELDEEKSENPSDEVVNQLLHEGDVFFKEKAGSIEFPNHERIEFVETDGALSEMEFVRGDSLFKCTNLKMREACSCVK